MDGIRGKLRKLKGGSRIVGKDGGIDLEVKRQRDAKVELEK